MNRLIICFDGTWNTPAMELDGVPVPTNVFRIYTAVADYDSVNHIPQKKYYHTGVGTEGGFWSRLWGGAKGNGLNGIIMSGYKWLCGQWQSHEDLIYIFGFSRGAFAARSLAGFIAHCGLVDLAPYNDPWRTVDKVFFQGYRKGKRTAEWDLESNPRFLIEPGQRDAIFCVSVWDTVGALGIPDGLSLLNWFDRPSSYCFHDTELSDTVTHARHALALDENRGSFTATLWTGPRIEGDTPDPNVKQIWFPGEHGDVGGGRKERGLADGALLWMVDEMQALGLVFVPDLVKQIRPNYQGVAHNPLSGLYKSLAIQPRTIPCLCDENRALFHISALQRREDPPVAQAPYRPTVILKPGESTSVAIFASQRWNDTGIYLENDASYRFSAEGQWIDKWFKHDPEGRLEGLVLTNSSWKNVGRIVGCCVSFFILRLASLWGMLEQPYQRFANNRYVDLWGSKRVERAPWFSLIGVVANAGNPGYDGTPHNHSTFRIGSRRDIEISPSSVTKRFKPYACFKKHAAVGIPFGGYLYAFANDAWLFYGNNKGLVTMKVERLT